MRPSPVQGVDEKGLAAGADDGLQVLAAAVEVDEGLLHGLGLGMEERLRKCGSSSP